jgi:hypothetical protein
MQFCLDYRFLHRFTTISLEENVRRKQACKGISEEYYRIFVVLARPWHSTKLATQHDNKYNSQKIY